MQMPTDMFGRYGKERAGSSQNRMHHTRLFHPA